MASNMTNSSIDWLKIVRLNSFRVFLSVFINSRLLDEVAGGAGVTTSTPCGGTVFKYFGSKFGRRKSKSFVNSLLAPSRLFPFPPIPQRPAKGEPWPRLSILSRCSRNPFAAAATPPGPARVRAKGFFRPFALWPEFWWGFPCWTGFGRGLRAALAFRRQKNGCCGKICVNFANPPAMPPPHPAFIGYLFALKGFGCAFTLCLICLWNKIFQEQPASLRIQPPCLARIYAYISPDIQSMHVFFDSILFSVYDFAWRLYALCCFTRVDRSLRQFRVEY